MAAIEPSLFDWRDVDARSDLDRFQLARDHLPDAPLLQYLEVMRGAGRDDYPVAAMWNALIAGVVFQHPSVEALLRELGRNPRVAAGVRLCGLADPAQTLDTVGALLAQMPRCAARAPSADCRQHP
jgi:hypothetical protein